MSLTGHRSENTWSAEIMLKVTGSAVGCYAENCNVNVSFTDVANISCTSLPEVRDQNLCSDTVDNINSYTERTFLLFPFYLRLQSMLFKTYWLI